MHWSHSNGYPDIKFTTREFIHSASSWKDNKAVTLIYDIVLTFNLVQYNWWPYTDPKPPIPAIHYTSISCPKEFLGVLYIYRLRAESPTAPDIPPPTQELSNLTQFYPSNLQLTWIFPKFNPDQVCKFCIKLTDSTMAVSALGQKALRTISELKTHFCHLLWSLKISLQSKFTYSKV